MVRAAGASRRSLPDCPHRQHGNDFAPQGPLRSFGPDTPSERGTTSLPSARLRSLANDFAPSGCGTTSRPQGAARLRALGPRLRSLAHDFAPWRTTSLPGRIEKTDISDRI